MVNQLRQSVVYQRQRSILGAMKKSDSKAKDTIKSYQKIILEGNRKGKLFGKKLGEKLAKQGSNDPNELAKMLIATKKPKTTYINSNPN